MASAGWGKPRILIKKIGGESWEELPAPVENSTQLTTTKGDKKDAKIEGGENEDVKYSKNTYALTFNIRAMEGRKQPIPSDDGVIADLYAVAVQPENPKSQGFAFLKAAASVEDSFTAEDGGIWAYTFDALKKDKSSKQIYWGVVSITETGGAITKVEIDPEDTTGDTDKIEI